VISKRYGVLPSDLLSKNINDLSFNLLIANTGIEKEKREYEKFNKR
jgi:hypothetical protein